MTALVTSITDFFQVKRLNSDYLEKACLFGVSRYAFKSDRSYAKSLLLGGVYRIVNSFFVWKKKETKANTGMPAYINRLSTVTTLLHAGHLVSHTSSFPCSKKSA